MKTMKIITISQDEGGDFTIDTKGFTPVETVGALRFMERYIGNSMVKGLADNEEKKRKEATVEESKVQETPPTKAKK